MFVNIIRRQKDVKPVNSIYQCARIQLKNTEKDDSKVYVDLEGCPDALHFELVKEETQIYVMNDNGKTIDSYRWS